jgi:hypothetical protein
MDAMVMARFSPWVVVACRKASVARFGAQGKHVTQEAPPHPHAAARSRFKQLMGWAFALSLVVVAVTFTWLVVSDTPLQVHLFVAVALGIIAVLMLAAALMGLVFLSSATGRDQQVGFDEDGGPRS